MPTAVAPELFFGLPIQKTEKAADGSLLVYGKATDASLDLDEQIVDPDFARRALKEWFGDWANIRQQHSGALPPAGVGVELDDRDDGQWLKSKVYEPGAVKQVEQGGYKAYSVGIARPRIVRDAKAPNGRVVDGIVVEVSLVDRPANPACKFAITKGYGQDMEVLGKSVEPDAGKRDVSGAERERLGDQGHAVDLGQDKPSYPISNEGDLRNAIRAYGRSNPGDRAKVRRHIMSEARRLGRTDLIPDDWKGGAKKSKGAKVPDANVKKSDDRMCLGCGTELDDDDKFCSNCGKAVPQPAGGKAARPSVDQRPPVQPGEVPYAIRRLHDACCAAYSVEELKGAYPVLEKDGIAAALGPGAKLALWQMLNQEVQEDAGTGSEALDIHHMGEAYKHLCEFMTVEAGQAVDTGDGDAPGGPLIMLAAHSDLHAAFAALNKDIMPSGGPSIPSAAGVGQLQPGQFRRPYLGAGHQRENGVSASPPSMPDRTHDVAATDFQRPALTDGQERQSPGSGKRAAITAMEALHDRVALQFPELCPMDLRPARVANQDQANPRSVQLGAAPDVVKAAAQAERKIKRAKAKARKAKRLTKALKPALKEIAGLKATLNKLASEPDPAAAAHRGVTMVTKAAPAQAQKRAAEDAQAQETQAYLEVLAMDPDPQTRLRAQERLAALEKRAQPALTT